MGSLEFFVSEKMSGQKRFRTEVVSARRGFDAVALTILLIIYSFDSYSSHGRSLDSRHNFGKFVGCDKIEENTSSNRHSTVGGK